MHEQIETTVPKAKELVRFAEKIISSAKRQNLAAQRKVAGLIQEKEARRKLFEVLVPRYESRSGGYMRLIRTGFRQGDAAPMAMVKLLN